MKFDNKVVFVSGANRGIGKAIVEALLKHPVKKIYAAARNPESLPKFGDARVVPVTLDITNRAQIAKAVQQAGDTDILINNAGVATFAGIVGGTPEQLKNDMEVNYFGTLSMVNAFVPTLEKHKGSVANVISVVGLASIATLGGYSASKAALFSATQAIRVELKSKGVSVHGIFPGPIDTDMAKGIEMDKTSPAVTAENIIAGLEAGKEDIFPDPMSVSVNELWEKNPKGLEQQFASMAAG
jgi:NAD(P)-dependent dehydrogenase (short-subunit alcohol dehydrogenase family)